MVTAADVVAIPYIGNLDLVDETDNSNVNIQSWPGRGLVIRGLVRCIYLCRG